jgi:hypothetical protein
VTQLKGKLCPQNCFEGAALVIAATTLLIRFGLFGFCELDTFAQAQEG